MKCGGCVYEASDPDELREKDAKQLCWGCYNDAIEREHGAAATAHALEHCAIYANSIERYDPAHHYAPSAEQYSGGDKFAYTPNALRAHNRHEATNYDELIRPLLPDDPVGQVYYSAIRARIEELLDEEELEFDAASRL